MDVWLFGDLDTDYLSCCHPRKVLQVAENTGKLRTINNGVMSSTFRCNIGHFDLLKTLCIHSAVLIVCLIYFDWAQSWGHIMILECGFKYVRLTQQHGVMQSKYAMHCYYYPICLLWIVTPHGIYLTAVCVTGHIIRVRTVITVSVRAVFQYSFTSNPKKNIELSIISSRVALAKLPWRSRFLLK